MYAAAAAAAAFLSFVCLLVKLLYACWLYGDLFVYYCFYLYFKVLCRALGGKVGKANSGWDIGLRKVTFIENLTPSHFLDGLDEGPVSASIIECHQDEVPSLSLSLSLSKIYLIGNSKEQTRPALTCLIHLTGLITTFLIYFDDLSQKAKKCIAFYNIYQTHTQFKWRKQNSYSQPNIVGTRL